MKKLSTWVIVCASWALWLGCLYDPHESGGDVGRSEDFVVEDAWLSGRLPDVGTFDADAYEVDLDSDDVTIHVGARGGEDFGWAMTRLDLSVAELHATSGTLRASATGCTGRSHGSWDWDRGTTHDLIGYFETTLEQLLAAGAAAASAGGASGGGGSEAQRFALGGAGSKRDISQMTALTSTTPNCILVTKCELQQTEEAWIS